MGFEKKIVGECISAYERVFAENTANSYENWCKVKIPAVSICWFLNKI